MSKAMYITTAQPYSGKSVLTLGLVHLLLGQARKVGYSQPYAVEGPIQYDAAVDPAVGQQKLPGSPVAGQASVLIFPDLNTGNNIYKAVQRETGALAIGPRLQGLNKPVNNLSRGCTVDDIYNTVLLTAIQAQQL